MKCSNRIITKTHAMKTRENLRMLLLSTVAFFIVINIASAQNPPNSGKSWKTHGNTGTDPAHDFIGTPDSVDFIIKTNSQERIRTKADGDVIIKKNLCVDGVLFGDADTLVIEGVVTADTVVV